MKCRDCGEDKPPGEFSPNRRAKSGRSTYCKPCGARRTRESRLRRSAGISLQRRLADYVAGDPISCPDCGQLKAPEEFPRNRNSPTGRGFYCKPCHNKRGHESRLKVGGSRTYHLKRRYGITATQADEILKTQGGTCPICQTRPPAHVDHDHETGAVRGILCFPCNGGLGNFRDNPIWLARAIDYLNRTDRADTDPEPDTTRKGRV